MKFALATLAAFLAAAVATSDQEADRSGALRANSNNVNANQQRRLGETDGGGLETNDATANNISTNATTINATTCGSIIDTDVTLEEDLECNCAERGPNSEYAALTLLGPAKLDLNGHAVSCKDNTWDTTETDSSAVVRMIGSNAMVGSGTISGGNFGAVLEGNGRHVVDNVRIENTANDGLVVASSFNEISGCTFANNGQGYYPASVVAEGGGDEFAEDNCPGGYVSSPAPSSAPTSSPSAAPSSSAMPSMQPTVSWWTTSSSPTVVSAAPSSAFTLPPTEAFPCYNAAVSGDAIDIPDPTSSYNVIRNNIITNYGDDAISSQGSFNIITGNDITATPTDARSSMSGEGISIRGVGNQIINNRVSNTIKDGIDVKYDDSDDDCTVAATGGYNVIRDNTVTGPVDGKGIKIGSDDNFVVGNTASSAQDDPGFNIDRGDCETGGNRNYLADNVASTNGEEGFKIEASNNNVLVRNVASDNEREGFLLDVDGGRGVGNVFAGNTGLSSNGEDDVKVDDDDDCTQNAFVGNGDGNGDDDCTYDGDINLDIQF